VWGRTGSWEAHPAQANLRPPEAPGWEQARTQEAAEKEAQGFRGTEAEETGIPLALEAKSGRPASEGRPPGNQPPITPGPIVVVPGCSAEIERGPDHGTRGDAPYPVAGGLRGKSMPVGTGPVPKGDAVPTSPVSEAV
jgi:hypothetical protein